MLINEIEIVDGDRGDIAMCKVRLICQLLAEKDVIHIQQFM